MVERRRFERVAFLGKLELTAAPDGAPQPACSLNLSLDGVGAITPSVFPIGQVVTIKFFLKGAASEAVTDEVVGRIARLSAGADANTIGIQFLYPLTEAEHPWLVNKLVNA